MAWSARALGGLCLVAGPYRGRERPLGSRHQRIRRRRGGPGSHRRPCHGRGRGPPARAAGAPADQPPSGKTPEHRQELQQQVPLEHLKPKPPDPATAPTPTPIPAPATLPTLAPVEGLAGALPNTGVEPLALALTGLALVAMGVSFRAAATL